MTDRKILVVVDPRSNEQPAAERAAWLATRVSASLELFICDYDLDIDAGRSATVWINQPVRENLLRILREKLEAIAAPLRERGLEVAVDVAWDHPQPQDRYSHHHRFAGRSDPGFRWRMAFSPFSAAVTQWSKTPALTIPMNPRRADTVR